MAIRTNSPSAIRASSGKPELRGDMLVLVSAPGIKTYAITLDELKEWLSRG
jgi:hypothetical protein